MLYYTAVLYCNLMYFTFCTLMCYSVMSSSFYFVKHYATTKMSTKLIRLSSVTRTVVNTRYNIRLDPHFLVPAGPRAGLQGWHDESH